jgi:hypothetical protein
VQRRTPTKLAARRARHPRHPRPRMDGFSAWVPVRRELPAAQALRDAGWAVIPRERFRIDAPPGIRITTAALEQKGCGAARRRTRHNPQQAATKPHPATPLAAAAAGWTTHAGAALRGRPTAPRSAQDLGWVGEGRDARERLGTGRLRDDSHTHRFEPPRWPSPLSRVISVSVGVQLGCRRGDTNPEYTRPLAGLVGRSVMLPRMGTPNGIRSRVATLARCWELRPQPLSTADDA